MEEMEGKVKIKLVRARHKNLIFYVPTKEGTRKVRIRMANKIRYLIRLTKFVEQNGKMYIKPVHSIYNGRLYYNEIRYIELTKEQLLKMIDKPGRKAEMYNRLMSILTQ